jgi:hypothetical protein
VLDNPLKAAEPVPAVEGGSSQSAEAVEIGRYGQGGEIARAAGAGGARSPPRKVAV